MIVEKIKLYREAAMGARVGIASMFLLALAACATTEGPPGGPRPTVPQTAAYNAADFAWSKAPGHGRITGQLSYKSGGVAFVCSGAPVLLTPETRWVAARMQVLYQSTSHAALAADEVRRRTPPERSQDYSGFVRRATCDEAGRFVFTGLPDGAWYLITVARPPAGVAGRETAIMRRVALHNAQALDVKL